MSRDGVEVDDLDVYLDVLFDGLEGYVYSPIKGVEFEQHWFSWPQERSSLKKHISDKTADGDVYISPAVYSTKRATKDAIKKIQCVWLEFDGTEQIDFRAVAIPNLIVQTSFSSHVHCYWRVGKADFLSIEDTNRRLTYHLNADGSGWDATQLLRPPTTINHKRDLPVVLAHRDSTEHSLADFETIPKYLPRLVLLSP